MHFDPKIGPENGLLKMVLLFICLILIKTISATNQGNDDGESPEPRRTSINSQNQIPNLGIQPRSFILNCLAYNRWRIPVPSGDVEVACLFSLQQAQNMVYREMVSRGLLYDWSEMTAVWNKTGSYLRQDHYVLMCILHCHNGTPYPRFRYIAGFDVEEPSRINIGCDDWSNLACKETCPSSALEVSNGNVTCTEDSFTGSVCQLHCNQGYVARGPTVRHCNANITAWLPAEPFSCEETCPSSELQVLNGNVVCTEEFFVGSICQVHCDQGYVARGPTFKHCNVDVSAWLPTEPFTCEAECPSFLFNVDNGVVSCTDGSNRGSICELHCEEGYLARGSPTRTCDSSDSWSPNEPFRCQAVQRLACPPLEPVAYGRYSCSSGQDLFSKCELLCNNGYAPFGPVQHWCLPGDNGRNVMWHWLSRDNVHRSSSQSEGPICVAIAPLHETDEEGQDTSHHNNITHSGIEVEQLNFTVVNGSKTNIKRFDVCGVAPSDRVPCGNARVTQALCVAHSCCWDSEARRGHSCYEQTETPENHAFKINKPAPSLFPPTHAPEMPNYQPQVHFPTSPPPTPSLLSNLLYNTHPIAVSRQCSCNEMPRCLTPQLTAQPSFSRSFANLFGIQYPLLQQRTTTAEPATTASSANDSISMRIHCGQPASAEKYPWHALVKYNRQLCGGTLIATQYVLTAAHCLMPADGSLDEFSDLNLVGFGITDKSQVDPNHQIRRIARVTRHPNFTLSAGGYSRNDIAIIKLDRPVNITGIYVRPLCLPNLRPPQPTDECWITGFGKTSTGTLPNVLQEAPVPLVSMLECQRSYYGFVVPGQNICAGSLRRNSADTCKGDSGGPLMCKRRQFDGSCSIYLAGITSFGSSPCGQGRPGVYVNVFHYQNWIHRTVSHMDWNLG